MFPCINVCGYLGLFNVKESDVKYALNKELAKQLIASNDTFNIPLVVSHVNFRVDLTVGFLTELTIDSRGRPRCKARHANKLQLCKSKRSTKTVCK